MVLELRPEIEGRLEAKARERGMAFDTFVVAVLEREATADGEEMRVVQARNWEFLRLLEELSPTIEAGTLRTVGEDEVARLIEAAREENDGEFEAAIYGR